MAPGILALATLLCGLNTPAQAAYRPEHKVILKGKNKVMLKEALAALNSLPDTGRWAIIASRLELYFADDGSSKYSNSSHNPNSGARFVGADGEEHDFNSVRNSIPPVQWRDADNKVYDLGANAIFPSISREVTALIYATAKSIAASMPIELRDAWLAEEAGLLYSTTGANAYGKGTESARLDSGKVVKRPKLLSRSDLRFKDSSGQEQVYTKVLVDHTEKWSRRLNILYLCIQYTSRKEILSLFADEVSTLNRNANTKKVEDNSAADEESTPTRMIEALSNMSEEAQEAFLVEQLGMFYMPDGTSAVTKKRARSGARYIGGDGEEHDLAATLAKISPADMAKATDAFRNANKSLIIKTFSDDLKALTQEMGAVLLKAMPELLRDAWISEVADLCYATDGNKAYTGKYGQVSTEKGTAVKFKGLNLRSARFVDRNGKEHKPSEREALWVKWGKRWTILNLCVQLGGADAILNTVAQELDALRRAHSKVTGTPYTPPANLASRTEDQKPAPQSASANSTSSGAKGGNLPTTPPAMAPASPSDSPALAAFKKLTPEARDAWLARYLGFCFEPNYGQALSGEVVNPNVLFIGSDGKEHLYASVNAQTSPEWIRLVQNPMMKLNEIIASCPDLVAHLAKHTLKYHLQRMPELMRDAFLCESTGLYFMEDGSKAYTGTYGSMRTGSGFESKYMGFNKEAHFVDAKGADHTTGDRTPYWDTVGRPWRILYACAHLLGAEEASTVVPELMETLRKNNPKADKSNPLKINSLIGELKGKVFASAVSRETLNKAVEHVRSMTQNTRDAWLSEVMGFVYMKDNSPVIDERNWVKKGAFYINSAGEESDFWKAQIGADVPWAMSGRLLKENKYLALDEFTSEVEALAFAAAKHHLLSLPQFMRDAWIAEAAGLCFYPDRDNDPYALMTLETENKNAIIRKLADAGSSFVDTTGVRHNLTERKPYWAEYSKRWMIIFVSLKYCPLEKILAAFPREVDAMRKNYEAATKRKAPGAATAPAEDSTPSGKTVIGTRR